MATVLRKTFPGCQALADAINDLKAQIGPGAFFHLDKCERVIVSPNATDLPTSLVLVNEIRAVYNFHIADSLALKAVDTVNTIASGPAIDLATAQTLANQIKVAYTAHIASTTYNYAADATNTIAAANATDQTTLNTLVNALKTAINAHLASGPAAKSIRVVSG